MKRTLRRAIVARGFSVEQADKLLERNGFEQLLAKWEIFEKEHRTLPTILGPEWEPIKGAKGMRNELVHGNKVYPLTECRTTAKAVLSALRKLHKFAVEDYGVDPWQKQPKCGPALQWRG
jgi:hypothetical protein